MCAHIGLRLFYIRHFQSEANGRRDSEVVGLNRYRERGLYSGLLTCNI
jgi:hypothetical protein